LIRNILCFGVPVYADFSARHDELYCSGGFLNDQGVRGVEDNVQSVDAPPMAEQAPVAEVQAQKIRISELDSPRKGPPGSWRTACTFQRSALDLEFYP
jgi:hypothetical protein